MGKIQGYDMPEKLYYHTDHTWLRIEEDGQVTIGMSDFYVQMAGDTTYADLPDEDDDVEQGETAGKIQSSKWVGKLISPISGEVVEINEELEDDFMLINRDCYDEGWIMKVDPSDLDEEIKNLHHGPEAVERFLIEEIAKLDNQ